MLEARFIDAIKQKQSEIAHESLKRPTDKSAFEFGRVSGLYQGLEMALQVIEGILNQADRDEDEQSGKWSGRQGR